MPNGLQNIPQYITDYLNIIIEKYGRLAMALFGVKGGNITAIGFFTLLIVAFASFGFLYIIITSALERVNFPTDENLRRKLGAILSISSAFYGTIIAPLAQSYIWIFIIFYIIGISYFIFILSYFIISSIFSNKINENYQKIISAGISLIITSILIIPKWGFVEKETGTGMLWGTILVIISILISMIGYYLFMQKSTIRSSTTLSSEKFDENRFYQEAQKIRKELENIRNLVNRI